MRKRVLLAIGGCLALGLIATPGQAAPVATGALGIEVDGPVQKVHDDDRRYRWYRRDRWRDRGYDGWQYRYNRWQDNDGDRWRYRYYDRYRWYYYQDRHRRYRYDY